MNLKNIKFKTPHNLCPRLTQVLLVTGLAGLLYVGGQKYSGAASVSAMPEMTAATENEAATVSEADSKNETTTTSEADSKSETTTTSEADSKSETTTTSETASTNETGTKSEMATPSATPTVGETDSKSKTKAETSDTSNTIVEYKSEPGKEPESETMYKVVERTAPGAPYAAAEDMFSAISKEASASVRLQPDYLDLTKISLSWEHLDETLTSMTESYSGEWNIYIKDLSSGKVININPHPMESASLIKLYIMGAVMEKIHCGTLEETDTINTLLEKMITVSDNEAANELVRYLSDKHDHKDGLTYVNDFAKRHGFADTRQVNGLEDRGLWFEPSGRNETSAGDCGELLSLIYNGELVSHLASRRMEDLLLAQEITWKIPYALPDEAVSANKTGEISDAENDSAIIYSPGGDFILCIMSSKWDNGNQAIERIREITRMVYRHFNPQTE